MHDRIRLIREDQKLSRAAFGERLGVSGDVINNLERGRVEPKEHIVKLLCLEFNVDEKWLKTGIGSMYLSIDNDSIDHLIERNGADDLEISIVKAYFELDKDLRAQIVDHFKEKFTAAKSPVDLAEEEYIKSRSSSAQNTSSSALNIISEKNNA